MGQQNRKLLVVDDDEALRRQLTWAFEGLTVVHAGDRETALARMRAERPTVVLLDLGLPPDPNGPSEGLATLEAILAEAAGTKVVIMTGQAERECALRSVALGAYDFYEKPIEFDTLKLVVERAFKIHSLEEENRRLATTAGGGTVEGFITTNSRMLKRCAEAQRFSPTDVSVLLIGESGTGKELLARGIHDGSTRAGERFLAINCAAIPDQLLESELFGHERGSFTGAVKTTVGKVELANGGTLFLDEIGDLPPPLQAKLLRFLQERVIERIGGREQIPVDVRIVSATHRDLPTLIGSGGFREDLYYRLAEAVIEIPPLRERPEDILLIAHHLLDRLATEQGRSLRGFTTEALAAMSSYSWPGNVRELQNRIKRAFFAAAGPKVSRDDLDLPVKLDQSAGTLTLKEAREKAERDLLRNAMIEAEGNISKAAKLLDVSRPTLYYLLKQHNMKS